MLMGQSRGQWLLARGAYLPSLDLQKWLRGFPGWTLEMRRAPRGQKGGQAASAAAQGRDNRGRATAAAGVRVLPAGLVGLREKNRAQEPCLELIS